MAEACIAAGVSSKTSPLETRALIGRAELSLLEDRMASAKDKRPDDVPGKKSDADGAIVDEDWSNVDLHDRKKTSDAGTPSDLEPQGG